MNKVVTHIAKLSSKVDDIEFTSIKCSYSTCQSKPINSHTIPTNYFTKLNQDLKNVRTFQPKVTPLANKKSPKIVKEINKDKCSTFRGFCETCDNDLFELIDNYDGTLNQEKATLIHYRNICYGINHVNEQLLKVDYLSSQEFINISTEGQTTDKGIGEDMFQRLKDGSAKRRLEYCLNEHIKRKVTLEKMIKKKDFNNLQYAELDGGLNNPLCCGRTTYFMAPNDPFFKISGYSIMPWITYLTLRTENSLTLVFCWLKSDKNYSRKLKVLCEDEVLRKELIAKLAYGHSDAFAMDKSIYEEHKSTINEIISACRMY